MAGIQRSNVLVAVDVEDGGLVKIEDASEFAERCNDCGRMCDLVFGSGSRRRRQIDRARAVTSCLLGRVLLRKYFRGRAISDGSTRSRGGAWQVICFECSPLKKEGGS
jgi:hypothetical protein